MAAYDWSDPETAKAWNKYTEEEIFNIYNSKVLPRLEDIRMMFFNGYSFSDVAKELDVSNSLLWKMRKNPKSQYAPLRDCFKFSAAQIQNVETSLYRRAVGYYYEADEVVKGTKEYFNKKGKKCKETIAKIVTVRRYVEPDTNAIKFFLLNHAAKQYSPEGAGDQAGTQAIIDGLQNVFVSVKRKADEEGKDE